MTTTPIPTKAQRVPLKIHGSKHDLLPFIGSNVVWDFRYNATARWIEPFAGSCVVAFNIAPMSALLYDNNPWLMGLYDAIRRGRVTSDSVRDSLTREGALLREHGESYYYAVRERFNTAHDLHDFLFLVRASFNGVLRFNASGGFNTPVGRNASGEVRQFSTAMVNEICEQVSWVKSVMDSGQYSFGVEDFRSSIPMARPDDFIYLDPPYFGRNVGYHTDWLQRDEDDLFDLLCASPARVMLSTWVSAKDEVNPAVDRYLKAGFKIKTFQHSYKVGPFVKNRYPALEGLLINYEPTS